MAEGYLAGAPLGSPFKFGKPRLAREFPALWSKCVVQHRRCLESPDG